MGIVPGLLQYCLAVGQPDRLSSHEDLRQFLYVVGALGKLALMALMLASGSSLKRVGTGPAAASPSNMVVVAGQFDSETVGMSSL